MQYCKYLLLPLLFLLSAGRSSATHYYGVDLFYTHISGNKYRVTVVSYGDCSGEQFPSFAATRPLIYIRRGVTDSISDYLDPEPPRAGVEVTPVCPAELNNTTCVNPSGSVPGVKKFVYSKEFTLSGPAPDWKFVFLGETDGNIIAGRSNSLTNVNPPGVISLEATLDNTKFNNSSPVYTTIATPFYCINNATNFNPGAVDADGDSLVYELVPGLNPTGGVIYATGFTGSNPLAVKPGAFSFSKKTGQLTFTPNTIQRSLVVYRVFEYRKGVLLGTSMREMTVVIMACNNAPPVGYISGPTGAGIVDSVTVKTCNGIPEVAFDINPTDADAGHTIKMEANGLPKDAKLNITGNSTIRPTSRFTWQKPDLPDGDYTFYITYTDNGCPIASRQVQAYTIRVVNEKIASDAIPEGCLNKGLITVYAPQGWTPWSFKLYDGDKPVYTKENISSNNWSDSMGPGSYRIEAVSAFGCKAGATAEVPSDCDIADLPNAFSPNGDGRNEILFVKGRNVKEMLFRIYNRWGQLVFESRDINAGWDGKFNGDEAPMETYAYGLSVVFKTGQTFSKQGNITLLR